MWHMLFLVPLLGSTVNSFQFEALLQHIDNHQDEYVETLRDWVAVESDSSNVQMRTDLHRMMEMTAEKLRMMNGKVEMVDTGLQQLPDGTNVPLPRVVTAEFGSDPSKLTVCVYGHMDVQPARKEDGWSTDPYNLTEINGNLYGRGASDDKGQVLAWIHAVEAYQNLSIELPVNIKFIFEGVEEIGSPGLDVIKTQKDTFFSNVDHIIISDGIWLRTHPALIYGTRGLCTFQVEIQGPNQDLHSGHHGGIVVEPMIDLIGILNTLISPSGEILIPGINEAVAPLTDEERTMLQNLEFDLDYFNQSIGIDRFMYDTQEEILSHRWRYPALSIHGIEGAFSAPGSKTVIPARVIGKFSIRLVPNMVPDEVEKQVKDYLEGQFAKRKTPNRLKIFMPAGSKPWLADTNHLLYKAGKAAVQRVFKMEPDMIRAGGSIPVAQTFQDVMGKGIVMLPIGGFDDGLHSQNEKISRYNYVEGTKLFAVYIYELSQLKD